MMDVSAKPAGLDASTELATVAPLVSRELNLMFDCRLIPHLSVRHSRSSRLSVAIAAATILLSCAGAVIAENPSPRTDPTGVLTIDRVDVGFRGAFKVGRWSPVAVQVTAQQPVDVRLVLEVADPDGSITSLPGSVQHLAAGNSQVVRGIFRSGRIDSGVRVILRDAASPDVILASQQIHVAAEPRANEMHRALTHAEPLIATLGNPAGFVNLDAAVTPKEADTRSGDSKKTAADNDTRFHVAKLESPDELPIEAAAYDSLDVLAIAGRFDLDESRSNAVRDWVKLGGHLVIAVGGNSEPYTKSALAKWIPVPIAGTSQLRDLSALESFVGKNVRIDFRGLRTVSAARLGSVDGVVDVRSVDGTLLVQIPLGFGKVSFIALDISSDPFPAWNAAPDFARRVASVGLTSTAEKTQASHTKLTHTGITDLATQIHATQDVFPEVSRLSMWSVMGLLVLYLLTIGPLDYLVVHRLLRRPELTWITFPLIVAGAAGIAVWSAGRTNGETLKVNQIDMVDVDVQSNLVRARSWLTLYSPQSARYYVSAQPKPLRDAGPPTFLSSVIKPTPVAPASDPVRIVWNGIPEASYSGMYRLGGFEIARPPYAFAENASAIDNLPVHIWSTKGLTASWSSFQEKLVESELSGSPAGLSGSIVHHMSAPIKDWVLAYGKMAYVPVSNQFNPEAMLLKPGRPLQISTNTLTRRNLSGFLTGLRRTVTEEGRHSEKEERINRDDYDPLGRNADQIVRMLTFYNKAGGKSYTTLENNDLRSLDLSGAIDLNRAVIFGKIAQPSAALEINGAEYPTHRGDTYVRIVLPVKESQSASENN